jgi:nicotinamide-nucleotide amidase
MSDFETLKPLAAEVIAGATAQGLKIATAESCTGGLVAAALTEIPGASAVVERGLVTYSNEAKVELLGVSASLIAGKGAVSEDVAKAMAEGALAHSAADLAVAITGIAGPDGGSPDKPVGLVHFAVARRGRPVVHARHIFPDAGRAAIRLASVRVALSMLRDLIAGGPAKAGLPD